MNDIDWEIQNDVICDRCWKFHNDEIEAAMVAKFPEWDRSNDTFTELETFTWKALSEKLKTRCLVFGTERLNLCKPCLQTMMEKL